MSEASAPQIDKGRGPPFETSDLPESPKWTLLSTLRWMGPAGFIAIGIGIGSGEFLLAPAVTVRFGIEVIVWTAILAIVLQAIQNVEMARYTILTGEPITIGFLRLPGGPKLWLPLSLYGTVSQVMWPGWAAAGATALVAMQLGRLPTPEESGLVAAWAIVTFILMYLLVMTGAKTQRSLDIFFKVSTFTVVIVLIISAIWLVPGEVWWRAAKGFVSWGYIPPGMDWVALGAAIGYAGLGGGYFNAAITNWYRDKGVGMGAKVGYIPGLIGGHKLEFSPVGKSPPATPKNIRNFKGWMRLIHYEMWIPYFFFGLIGMIVPSMLYQAYVKEPLGGWGVAAMLAEGVSKVIGPFGWYLMLIIALLILYPTQVGVADEFPRQIIDMLWFWPRVRKACRGDIRIPYYTLIAILWIFGIIIIATRLVRPLIMLVIAATAALLGTVITGVGTFLICVKLLPKEYKPSLWRLAALLVGAVFFGFFFIISLLSYMGIRL